MTTFSRCSIKWQLAELLDLLLIYGGLITEVEGVQALHKGEAGQIGPHGDVLGCLGSDLLGQESIQKVGIGQLLRGSFLQQRFQALATLDESQS